MLQVSRFMCFCQKCFVSADNFYLCIMVILLTQCEYSSVEIEEEICANACVFFCLPYLETLHQYSWFCFHMRGLIILV